MKAFSVAALCCFGLLWPQSLQAQVHYDPFFGLPTQPAKGGADRMLVTAGLVNDLMGVVRGWQVLPSYDLLTSRTDAMIAARYSLGRDLVLPVNRWGIGSLGFTRGWEFGLRVTSGMFNDFSSDGLSTLVLGAKQPVSETRAVSIGWLVPVGDADRAGLSVGYLQQARIGRYLTSFPILGGLLKAVPGVREIEGWRVDHWLNFGFLEGYSSSTSLLEPAVGSLAETRLGRWPFVSLDLASTILQFDRHKAAVNIQLKVDRGWFVAGISKGLVGEVKQGGYGAFGLVRWRPELPDRRR